MCFGFSKHKKDEDGNRQELWRFYEKAIDGRDSFYKHYVQYMNLYAIFTGAFLFFFLCLMQYQIHPFQILYMEIL